MSDIHHDEFLGNSKQESSRLKKIPASTHASVTVWLSVHSELISLDSLFFTPVLERPNTWLRNVKLHDPSPISATTDNREGVTQYTGGCAFPDENQGVVGACHELTAGKTHLPTVSRVRPCWKMGLAFPSLKKPANSQGLTERHRLVDLEAAEDPVHIASMSKAISSHDYLK